MTYKFSRQALTVYRDAQAVLEAAYYAKGLTPPRREMLPPLVGCEIPAWLAVDDMERFLATLPPNVCRVDVVIDFLKSGCPIQLIPAEDYFHALSELDKRAEVS